MSLPSAKKKLSDWVSFGASIIACYCSGVSVGRSYTYCHELVLFGTQKGKENWNELRTSPRKKCFSINTRFAKGKSPLTLENSRLSSRFLS